MASRAKLGMGMNMINKLFRFLFILATSILIIQCANQLPPGGGEVDNIPPRIIEVIPIDRTKNFNQEYFELIFSEYVDKRSVQEAIFISPPIPKGVKYEWSGKSLSVFFNDSLKTNTTYTITVGAEVQDLNNRNKMVEPFTFAFSTGSVIDTGSISGKIFDDNPSGIMIYAYFNIDTVANPILQKPDYISQVGKNGKYILPGLGEGKYNVFAFRDKYQDFFYKRNEDEFGVQFKEINLTRNKPENINNNFFINIEDTLAPKLSSVIMSDRNHILLEFNEPIDSSLVSSSNFYLYDSSAQRKISLRYFFKGDARDKQYYLSLSDTLIVGNNLYLHLNKIFDKSLNESLNEITSITVKDLPDTIAPKILKITGTEFGDKVDYDNPIISVKFDDGFDLRNISESIKIMDDKNVQLKFAVCRIDDASFVINLKDKLRQKADYKIVLDLSKCIDAVGNKIDSLYTHKFTTVSELDYTGVIGNVESVVDSLQSYVVLRSATPEKKTYTQKVVNKSFNMNKILPGKYLIWSFIDSNVDKKYNAGVVSPLKYAEEFQFYPDTLNLRARWPVGDIIIKFEKN